MNDGFGLEGGLARFLVFKTSVFAAILPIEIGHTWEGPIPTIPLMFASATLSPYNAISPDGSTALLAH